MDELKFVIKCFLFAAILMVLSQIKIGEETIESKIQSSLLSPTTVDFVNKVAEGGAKLVKNSIEYGKTYYFQSSQNNIEVNKAEAIKKIAENTDYSEEKKSTEASASVEKNENNKQKQNESIEVNLEPDTEWSEE